jgi:hypothetical protein
MGTPTLILEQTGMRGAGWRQGLQVKECIVVSKYDMLHSCTQLQRSPPGNAAGSKNLMRSRSSSVSIVSDYGLDDRATGVRFPAGAKDFSSNLYVQTGCGAHLASCTIGIGVLSRGKARLGRDAAHSPPSSAEVKNE